MNPAGRSAIFAPHRLAGPLPTRTASPVWAALGDLGAQGVPVGRSLEGLAGGMQLQHQFNPQDCRYENERNPYALKKYCR